MRGEERRPLETVIRVRPGGELGGPPGLGRGRRSVLSSSGVMSGNVSGGALPTGPFGNHSTSAFTGN